MIRIESLGTCQDPIANKARRLRRAELDRQKHQAPPPSAGGHTRGLQQRPRRAAPGNHSRSIPSSRPRQL